jgi:hypothetical protein
MSKRRTRRERGKGKAAQLIAYRGLVNSLSNQLSASHQKVHQYKQEAANARANMMRDMARGAADEVEFTKHMLQEASVEMGRMLGSELGTQLRRYDDVFAERRKIADSMLSIAMMGLNFDARESYEFKSWVIRIELPAIQQSFAIR